MKLYDGNKTQLAHLRQVQEIGTLCIVSASVSLLSPEHAEEPQRVQHNVGSVDVMKNYRGFHLLLGNSIWIALEYSNSGINYRIGRCKRSLAAGDITEK